MLKMFIIVFNNVFFKKDNLKVSIFKWLCYLKYVYVYLVNVLFVL